ncbi:MAG: hypothetical protein IPM91_07495 [Bacteroidetes bacterium]|nr:hypothetical protein [Bacteroidota bacterium]
MKKQILFFLTLAAISFTTRSQSQPLYFQWAAAFQGNSTSTPRSLAVCPNGDVLSTGSFSDTVDFDPGPGIAEVTTIDYQFGDLFVARLDASGNYVNAFGIGGIDEQDEGNNILTDAQNNVYSAGFFITRPTLTLPHSTLLT